MIHEVQSSRSTPKSTVHAIVSLSEVDDILVSLLDPPPAAATVVDDDGGDAFTLLLGAGAPNPNGSDALYSNNNVTISVQSSRRVIMCCIGVIFFG
jgi:hypothetical protein